MTELGLEITENLQYNLGLPPEEAEELLRKELACALCEQGKLLPEGPAGSPSGPWGSLTPCSRNGHASGKLKNMRTGNPVRISPKAGSG